MGDCVFSLRDLSVCGKDETLTDWECDATVCDKRADNGACVLLRSPTETELKEADIADENLSSL